MPPTPYGKIPQNSIERAPLFILILHLTPLKKKKKISINLQQISPIDPTVDNKQELPFPFPSMPSGFLQQISHLLSCKLEI